MKKIDRFDKYMEIKGLNDNKVTVQLGLSVGTLGKSRKPDRDLSDRVVEQILNFYTDINSIWLLTGEGEMLKDVEEPISTSEDNTIPLIPMSARAGYLNDFMLSVRERDCERVISPIVDADLAIQVAGDSMEPEYPNGSIIVTKRIDTDLFIEWGKAYLLDTPNGAIVKILKPSERDGFIRCESTNPKYDAFDIPLAGVRGVYRVLISISVK